MRRGLLKRLNEQKSSGLMHVSRNLQCFHETCLWAAGAGLAELQGGGRGSHWPPAIRCLLGVWLPQGDLTGSASPPDLSRLTLLAAAFSWMYHTNYDCMPILDSPIWLLIEALLVDDLLPNPGCSLGLDLPQFSNAALSIRMTCG